MLNHLSIIIFLQKSQRYMKAKIKARNTKEFDRRFDAGEDIHDLIDMEILFVEGCRPVPAMKRRAI